jgi:hypothetical protein
MDKKKAGWLAALIVAIVGGAYLLFRGSVQNSATPLTDSDIQIVSLTWV